jgi:hypothetical protein
VIVISMARPVENDKGSVIVFFQDPAGEFLRHGIVLMACETVAEDDNMTKRPPGFFKACFDFGSRLCHRGKIYFTPYCKICTMQIEIFFHRCFSEKSNRRLNHTSTGIDRCRRARALRPAVENVKNR